MIEPLIAIAGLLICWIAGLICYAFAEDSLAVYIPLFAIGGIALYCLVRLIHWAWVTPMPFVNT
jgi:hypothetical protein